MVLKTFLLHQPKHKISTGSGKALPICCILIIAVLPVSAFFPQVVLYLFQSANAVLLREAVPQERILMESGHHSFPILTGL
jgi:hypothetical protein